MNKYDPFIWGSYGAGIIILAGLVGASLADLLRQKRAIARLEAARRSAYERS